MITFSKTKTLNKEERELAKTSVIPSEMGVGELLEIAEEDLGTLYTIYDDDKLLGVALYIQYGGLLNLRRLSAIEHSFKDWCSELQEFTISLMREHGIRHFQILSRYGWHKYCPKLVFEGCLYSFDLENDTPREK